MSEKDPTRIIHDHDGVEPEVPPTYDGEYGGGFDAHFQRLFDQDEDGSGERFDAQNQNRPFDNSTATDESIILEAGHIDPNTDSKHDTQEHEIPELDAAGAWLAEHDVSLDTDEFPQVQKPEHCSSQQ